VLAGCVVVVAGVVLDGLVWGVFCAHKEVAIAKANPTTNSAFEQLKVVLMTSPLGPFTV
jgi:hypothetical protein